MFVLFRSEKSSNRKTLSFFTHFLNRRNLLSITSSFRHVYSILSFEVRSFVFTYINRFSSLSISHVEGFFVCFTSKKQNCQQQTSKKMIQRGRKKKVPPCILAMDEDERVKWVGVVKCNDYVLNAWKNDSHLQ